ncbi:glycosyltransferase family 4 protein [Natronosporangium hydrolyticum]|uniref:Glycosyltransferase family 4 protein n=1 Tax=Natronosporangium hydrolyticum TaxID=2811111 RepID=A0A895Y508_9ACTN|nr:glycosyltransferase family 4 protein [Natronosporangium hydrolyticum]QSB12784.1 glycosyltransferase family 4 protein [Natronosporangium hydrolyticum]
MNVVQLVLPSGIDDPGSPSGGNTYDRCLAEALSHAGWRVREHLVAGAWPAPTAGEEQQLADALARLPDGALTVIDGLVGCAAPEALRAAADRLRLVLLVHLPLADETGLDPAVAAARHDREQRSLAVAAAVIATSDWAARRLIESHHLPADQVHVAEPGVAPAPLAAGTDGAGQLLCVAALTPRKGHDVLVEALAQVSDRRWRCVCVGAAGGDERYLTRLREAAAEPGLAGRIELPGPRTGPALAATYHTADLLVLASHAETYGMVVTEALARGIPVIATEVGGVPAALGRAPDGQRPGLLVPPADPPALARALARWWDEPALRQRLRAAAQARRAALPGWAATAGAVDQVLAGLATTKEGPA